jgi:peptide/nickel transport system permease protein
VAKKDTMTQELATQSARSEVLIVPARARGRSRWLAASRRWTRHQPLGLASLAVILVMTVAAVFAPAVAPHNPTRTDLNAPRLQAPTRAYPFGTDSLGRDVLSEVIYGARVSLIAGVTATVLGCIGGSIIGLVAGYRGGAFDLLVQQVMDGIMAIPALVLLLLIATILGPSMWHVIGALSLVIIPYSYRVIRSGALIARAQSYVEAARVVGAGGPRIVCFHILPNVMALIIVIASITVGGAMLVEGALSFLGLGIPTDDPTWKTSWGAMLSPRNLGYMEQDPWLPIFPGGALMLAVLAFNLLGDSLRDILDPRLRGSV